LRDTTGFIDLNTSALTVPAILAALIARERTGMGQHIVASMLEAAVALQMSRMAEFFATGCSPMPGGSGVPYSVPDQAFRVRDGYLAVSARTQAEWERLCRALGQQALLDRLGIPILRRSSRPHGARERCMGDRA
jgi:crotonobetainyl-CoA:carnitine CoA-transferase CaiB-like acyl-CoA transferase